MNVRGFVVGKGRHQQKKTFSFGHCPNKGGGHSGLNQGVRISTDCFAETPVTVSFVHISCTF